jgi:hypothetical protein
MFFLPKEDSILAGNVVSRASSGREGLLACPPHEVAGVADVGAVQMIVFVPRGAVFQTTLPHHESMGGAGFIAPFDYVRVRALKD